MRFNIEDARKLLTLAGVFFGDFDDEEPEIKQTLNLNDIWFWGSADGQYVTDEEFPVVAELFYHYGWCGILYWVSEKRKGLKSEFFDNNRFIEFVKREEELRKEIPNDDERAYKKIKYEIGE